MRSTRRYVCLPFGLVGFFLMLAGPLVLPAWHWSLGGGVAWAQAEGAPASAPAVEAPPATAAPEPAAAPASAEVPPPQPAEPSPNLRLKELEQRVQALKEQAWRVKARIGMLKVAVLDGGIGARATIAHHNKMGGSFKLLSMAYFLDGQQVFFEENTSRLSEQPRFDILSGPINAGKHTLAVTLVYRGHGYGVFDYLKKYKFTVKSSHTFEVPEGKQTQLTVVGYERGGITTPLEKRPAVDFKVNVVSEKPAGK